MTDEICIAGFDPGVSGALAFYLPSRPNLIGAEDLPNVAGEIDADTLTRRIEQMRPAFAIIEQVAARPGQGISSTFKFGTAYGTIRGVIQALGIPSALVAPSRWKKHFRIGGDKEKARTLALRLWPESRHFSRKKDHNRSEAALLAKYAFEAGLVAQSSLEVAK